MIIPLTEFQYLGNSLETFNSNMQELNVRTDVVHSQKDRWNSLFQSFSLIQAEMNSLISTVSANGAKWSSSSDLVHNIKGYWEEPIMIAYKSTFNMIANFLEIETWLNDNFPSSSFSSTQILRCDFLCKNYSSDSFQGARIENFKPEVLEELASVYSTTVGDIFTFLGLRNQMNTLVTTLNFYLRKYNKNNSLLTQISDIENLTSLIQYNRNTDSLESEELKNFNYTDLTYFHSYLYQYSVINKQYDSYIRLNFLSIPEYILTQFSPKNIHINTGGNFFFKIRDGRWTYHPYTNIEFCSNNSCSDCYANLDINELYKYREPCLFPVKYILTECIITEPYVTPYVAPLGNIAQVVDLQDYDTLSQLFS